MGLDFERMSDRTLKDLAFIYHYGHWRSAEEAKESISGRAATEQARRSGCELHEPYLMKTD